MLTASSYQCHLNSGLSILTLIFQTFIPRKKHQAGICSRGAFPDAFEESMTSCYSHNENFSFSNRSVDLKGKLIWKSRFPLRFYKNNNNLY